MKHKLLYILIMFSFIFFFSYQTLLAQNYSQNQNDVPQFKHRSLHEFNRDLKSGNINNQTLELKPDESMNQFTPESSKVQPSPETIELKPENFY